MEHGGSKTALITGASSGIGAAFARQLAARGNDLILVARRENRLAGLAAELERDHAIVARYVAADLSSSAGVETVEDRIAGMDALSLLVNSAGFGMRGGFVNVEMARQIEMIQVHFVASVRLTRVALPGMIARGEGAIINVASVAAFIPLPGDVTYCATKASLVSFSRALQAELRGTGVRVQALCPGFTRTAMHDQEKRPNFDRSRIPAALWSSADEVAATSLKALARGQAVCVPGWKNSTIVLLARLGVVGLFLRMVRV